MGYYHSELSAKSKELWRIVTQWGKYKHQRLPMGLCNSPDIFQENMSELFFGLDTVRVYIADLLHVTKGSWKEDITLLEEMFTRLQKAGLKVNAGKLCFGAHKFEYLGYHIYQRKSRSLKPSQSQILANNCISSLVWPISIVTCGKSALVFLPN